MSMERTHTVNLDNAPAAAAARRIEHKRPRILALGVKLLGRIVLSDPARCDVDYYSCSRTDEALAFGNPNVRLFRWRDAIRIRARVKAGHYDLVLCEAYRHPAWSPQHPLRARFSHAIRGLLTGHERQGQGLVTSLREVPVVVVDLADSHLLAVRNRVLLRSATRYYKREIPANQLAACLLTGSRVMNVRHTLQQTDLVSSLQKVSPISLGISEAVTTLADRFSSSVAKQYDIFCSVQPGGAYALRAERYVQQLRDLEQQGYRVKVIDRHLPFEEYLKACAESWLVWSPEGMGWDCWRHYEVAAARSVPVINYPSIIRHAPMRHGVHAIFYDPASHGLKDAVIDALRDKGNLLTMASNARQLVIEHHTYNKQLARIVEECLRSSSRTGRG
jgi:hypothetical protein